MPKALLVAVSIFLVDVLTKEMVQARLVQVSVHSESPLRIRSILHVKPFFSSRTNRILLLFVWLTAVASALALHRFGTHFQSNVALCGLGAAFGGSAGNLRDILVRHGVVDFIDLGWWPVFNLADVAILTGLAAAFFG